MRKIRNETDKPVGEVEHDGNNKRDDGEPTSDVADGFKRNVLQHFVFVLKKGLLSFNVLLIKISLHNIKMRQVIQYMTLLYNRTTLTGHEIGHFGTFITISIYLALSQPLLTQLFEA